MEICHFAINRASDRPVRVSAESEAAIKIKLLHDLHEGECSVTYKLVKVVLWTRQTLHYGNDEANVG